MKRKETTKNSTKKRWSFNLFKKHRALSVSLVIIAAVVGSFLVVNYGRYVRDIIQLYYLRTKNFYFSSDKLVSGGKKYQINPWSGTEPYTINISMSNLDNSLKGTDDDISYNVKCLADSNSICSLNSDGDTEIDSIIYKDNHTDSFVVTITLDPQANVDTIDSVIVEVIATSKSPYVQTISAKFELIIGDYGVGYKIEDEAGRLYMDAMISNATPTDTYRFTLEISDVDYYSIDMSNKILSADGVTISEDADHNIYKIVFDVGPKSSMMVRYYKHNSEENNSFPIVGSDDPPKIVCTYVKVT